MKGYAIKVTSTATQSNPNFAGRTSEFLHFKGGRSREYGSCIWKDEIYKTKATAERAMRKEIEDYNYYKDNTTIYQYWDNEYEVIEVSTID